MSYVLAKNRGGTTPQSGGSSALTITQAPSEVTPGETFSIFGEVTRTCPDGDSGEQLTHVKVKGGGNTTKKATGKLSCGDSSSFAISVTAPDSPGQYGYNVSFHRLQVFPPKTIEVAETGIQVAVVDPTSGGGDDGGDGSDGGGGGGGGGAGGTTLTAWWNNLPPQQRLAATGLGAAGAYLALNR